MQLCPPCNFPAKLGKAQVVLMISGKVVARLTFKGNPGSERNRERILIPMFSSFFSPCGQLNLLTR